MLKFLTDPKTLAAVGFIGTTLLFAVATSLLTKAALWLLKKAVVRSKQAYVIWTHSSRHYLETADHNDPLFVCMDEPCDMLYMNAQALGVPAESVPLRDDK